ENFCREDISLEEMASHFGVSREHMSRLFRARTGMRYIDYITKLRMEKAWEMITTTDQSVSDIFRLVGYIDRSSSTKKFKKYFGITPSEARNKPGEEAF
ncbi:MAG: helix-turn-helix transcriptional regulator, partial [Clostridia bacterium]|nr:helix-turn-helix transcriptional regulator [Clostridia bacterium]